MPWKDPEVRRAKHREYMRQRYNTDPEHKKKQLARVKTKYADVPEQCERCGGPDPEGHHEDYDRPDDRVWLCRKCHLDEHSSENRPFKQVS